jgi:polar amino acid transport system permease protein
MLDFYDKWSGYIDLILQGALVTIELTIIGCALALVMAFVAGLGRLSQHWYLRWLATTYIEFFRGTSIFVQLFWAYFVLPILGLPITPLQAAILALGLNVGAYGAEVVRGAVRSIGREQYEACVACNLSRFQTMRHVILPQAFVIMLPTFGNNAIELLKGTAVVSLISLADMTFQAQVVRAQTGSTAVPFITILILYFLMASVIAWVVRRLENRLTAGLEGTRR